MSDRNENRAATQSPIAIVGIACVFPKASGLDDYWANVRDGVDAITEIPEAYWKTSEYYDADPKRPDMTYGRRGGFIDPIDFEPMAFGIPPRDLEATDSTQLLGLHVARQALQDAGYGGDGREFDREKTSVILGVSGTLPLVIPLGARLGYPIWRKALEDAGVDPETTEDVIERIGDGYVPWQENSFPGLLANVVAGRIANRLDLHGTNCIVDAACASSLSAVYLAALELESGRADMVLSGGLDTFNDIFMYMCFSKTPALSATGDARPFNDQADGTILGEGVGMLVLKRLGDAERDGDRIYAVIKGIGSSSDGKGQAVYAPAPEGQARALRTAYDSAGIRPDTVELVEGHGTGTRVGDATEAKGLTTVYREASPEGTWCALGIRKVDDRPHEGRGRSSGPDQDGHGTSPQDSPADHQGGEPQRSRGYRGDSVLCEHREAALDAQERPSTPRRRERLRVRRAAISTVWWRSTSQRPPRSTGTDAIS